MINRFQLLCLFVCGSFIATAQNTIYVKAGGLGDGTSWETATGELRLVLDTVAIGTQIWVAEGIYYPTNCDPCSESQRDITFQIPDSITLLGGFMGIEEEATDRDWQAHPTILSGNIDQDNTPTFNARSVIWTYHVSAALVVDGFIIEDAYASSSEPFVSARENSGGAWYNEGALAESHSNPTIRNCVFRNNTVSGFGGAIFNYGGFSGQASPILEHCIFENNTANFGGGAVFNDGSFSGESNPSFQNCDFTNNLALESGGGAVFSQGTEDGNSSPSFLHCDFSNNTTHYDGGALYQVGRGGTSTASIDSCIFVNNAALFGGAVSNDGSEEGENNSSFNDCIFKNNESLSDGGAIFNLGSNQGICNPVFLNCLFEENESGFAGAGVFNNAIDGESSPDLINCRFIRNMAGTYGGGVYNLGKNGIASPRVINCLFWNNQGSSAGGMYNLGSEGGNSSPTITNCTFYGNHADVGGAVYSNANDSTGNSSPIITNCIFTANTAPLGSTFRNIFGTPTIRYSLVDLPDCNALHSGTGSGMNCEAGMLYLVDPGFVDTLNGDFHLSDTALILDAGDNAAVEVAFDLDQNERIFNGIVDLGAFERNVFAPTVLSQSLDRSLCVGDSLSLSVQVNGTPPMTFQWSLEGENIANATAALLNIDTATLEDTGNYVCQIIGVQGDTVWSDAIQININPVLTATIQIVGDSTICIGDTLRLNALSENGGAMPAYQWNINGTMFTADTSALTFLPSETEHTIFCTLLSSEACIAEDTLNSEAFSVQVLSYVEPSVDLTIPEVWCANDTITIETITLNGGISPQFNWLVNGENVDSIGSQLTTADINDLDIIVCQMISSEQCVSPNPVSSTPIVASIHPSVMANVEILGPDTIICSGAPALFIANTEHGGTMPTYEWYLNGTPLGINQVAWVSADLEDGDQITCELNTSQVCVLEPIIVSEAYIVEVEDCLSTAAYELELTVDISIYPNPSEGNFTVQLLGGNGAFKYELYDIKGQLFTTARVDLDQYIPTNISFQALPSGIYYFKLQTKKGPIISKMLVQ